jgi:parallel beta-helix repeat protein
VTQVVGDNQPKVHRDSSRVRVITLASFLVACCVLLGKSVEAPASPPLPSQTVWVSVDGKSNNDGSAEHPLDLVTALSGEGPVRAGATVWVHGGVYRGSFTSTLNGTPEAPIIVRQAPGERVTIDSAGSGRDALSVVGHHTWFWGFEITSSDPKRHSKEKGSWPADLHRGYGAVTRAPGTRFINLVVHDNANGVGLWSEAVDADVYGSIIYNNGWQAPDRAHGHGVYTQNESGTRRLTDNIVFNQFSHGIHAYGSDQAHLDNITLEGNIVFNNGSLAAESEYVRNVLLGGGSPAVNPRLIENITYYGTAKTAGENNLGYGGGCINMLARGNYLIGGRPLVLANCQSASFVDNTLYGQTREEIPDSGLGNHFYTTPPAGTRVFVRPNRCESGRVHVAVFNWDSEQQVGVETSDTSLEAGERFVVLDAQNVFGPPVAEGVYDGNAVTIPMTGGAIAPPVGDVAPAPQTTPIFGAFVIVQPSVAARNAAALPDGCAADADLPTVHQSVLGNLLKRLRSLALSN